MNDECFSNIYQRILFDNEKTVVDKQRRCMAYMFNASCKHLDNQNTCFLLEDKLKAYTVELEKGHFRTYDKKLKEVLLNSKAPKREFTSNLNSININSFIKTSPCGNQFNCKQSEDISEQELEEFSNIYCKPIENEKVNSQKPKVKPSENKFYPQRENTTQKSLSGFRTAKDELQIQNLKKNSNQQQGSSLMYTGQKRNLGTRRTVASKFVSPYLSNNDINEDSKKEKPSEPEVDERLKNIEPKMIELITSEIMDCGPNITWDDIAGLDFAKTAIQEAVIWPLLRPDIFTGLRRPPKGILLFGPPGTGKTLIGKCVASQSKSTFFSISASSLTSKWVGDGEKMVRALFSVARVHQPAVIFIDEIDSLLSQRSDQEHECSRRMKTEFLVQLDGATTESEERLLVIGATNRPQELDEAARRRFVKRLYIPLPDYHARHQLVQKLITNENHQLNEENLEEVAKLSDGYSGADIRNLCSEASLGPIRSIDMSLIEKINANEVRPLKMEDFENAFNRVKSSVAPKDLEQYVIWNQTYGSGTGF